MHRVEGLHSVWGAERGPPPLSRRRGHARGDARGDEALRAHRLNERWRVGIAGLVAVLAIPVLVIDSPSTAGGGVEFVSDARVGPAVAAVDRAPEDVGVVASAPAPIAIVTETEAVRPDVARFARRAAAWAEERRRAVERGIVEPDVIDAPSYTNLSLLPVITEPEPETEAPPPAEEP